MDGATLAEMVSVGDNIAVPAHTDSEDLFWVFLCDKPIHEVASTFYDRFGNIYICRENL